MCACSDPWITVVSDRVHNITCCMCVCVGHCVPMRCGGCVASSSGCHVAWPANNGATRQHIASNKLDSRHRGCTACGRAASWQAIGGLPAPRRLGDLAAAGSSRQVERTTARQAPPHADAVSRTQRHQPGTGNGERWNAGAGWGEEGDASQQPGWARAAPQWEGRRQQSPMGRRRAGRTTKASGAARLQRGDGQRAMRHAAHRQTTTPAGATGVRHAPHCLAPRRQQPEAGSGLATALPPPSCRHCTRRRRQL